MKRAAKVLGVATVVLAIYAVTIHVVNRMMRKYIRYESNNGYDDDYDDFFEDDDLAAEFDEEC